MKKIRLSSFRFSRLFASFAGNLSVLLLFLTLASLASAHPIHTSYAEADFRPETGKLEVALRVYPDDLEAALTARAGKKITLEHTRPPAFDVLLLAYLRATFLLRTADGTTPTLHLVGRELKDRDQHLWIYFECSLPGGLTGARLSHRFLPDAFPEQLNALRPAKDATTLLFLNDTEKALVTSK
ncbi:MAG: hypothetical protein H7343_00570 [Undibacterium sp.]|nr:hypothetical protein [Opitutaceae bacterium]